MLILLVWKSNGERRRREAAIALARSPGLLFLLLPPASFFKASALREKERTASGEIEAISLLFREKMP